MYNHIHFVYSYQLWPTEQFEKQNLNLSANLLAQIIQPLLLAIVFSLSFPKY